MIEMPDGVTPIRDTTTAEILYGPRTTSFRYEILAHDPVTGLDSLAGYLDGVEPGGSLSRSASTPVKKSGSLKVLDVATAQAGLLRIADVDRVTARIRPVRIVEGLPEMPRSVYVITAAPETWTATGREYELELHDKSTVLDQDEIDQTYTVAAGTVVLTAIAAVIASAGEKIAVDASDKSKVSAPMSWPVGTTKLVIVNDLLEVIHYNGLWVDDDGNFRATPYVAPVDRSIRYTMLNDETGAALVRELTDGETSIYSPNFSRDRDSFGVPNKVIAVQSGGASGEPLSGVATNENPDSPYSFQARGGTYDPVTGEPIGNWISRTISDVDVPDFSAEPDPAAATIAFLNAKAQQSLIDSSAVQAAVSLDCLPIPVELLEVVQFASTPAEIDARHTIQSIEEVLQFDGLMSLDLQEVIDL